MRSTLTGPVGLLLGAAAFSQTASAQSASGNVIDFATATTGVTRAGTTQLTGVDLSIRGRTVANGGDGNVAVSVDGILMTNPAALTRSIAGLESVEIAKGPSGRNASAGAFIVTTHKPGNDFEAVGNASVGDDDTYAVRAFGGGPIAQDKLSFSLHAGYRTTDGFYRNTFLNAGLVDDAENYEFGGRLVYLPNDDATLDVKANWSRDQAGNSAFNGVLALPVFAQFLNQPLFNEDVNSRAFAFQSNIRPVHRQRAADISAKWDQELDWGTLTAWVLYSDVNSDLVMDGVVGGLDIFNADAACRASTASLFTAGSTLAPPQNLASTPEGSLFGPFTLTACDGTYYQVRDQNDFSAEIRLSSAVGERLRWSVAGYFQHVNRHAGSNLGIDRGSGVTRQLFVPAGGTNPTEQVFDDRFKTDAFAASVDLAYDVLDNLEAGVVLRYDLERHKVSSRVPAGVLTTYVSYIPGGPYEGGAPLNPALDFLFSANGTIAPRRETFGQFTPEIGLTWAALDNLTLYANWGLGFKSGGFNNLGTQAAVDLLLNSAIASGLTITDRYAEEHASAFEGGFKSSLWGGRVSINAAGYYTRVKDMQFAELLVGPFGLLRAVNTIDRARIYGGEFDASLQIIDQLSIFAGGNVQSTRIRAMASRPDAVGNKVPYAPKYSFNGGAQFVWPLSGTLNFVARGDVKLVGPTAFHPIQCQNRPTLQGVVGNSCNTTRASFVTGDVRAGVQGENWSATTYVKNIGKERYLDDVIVIPEFGMSFTRPGALRRVGIDVAYTF